MDMSSITIELTIMIHCNSVGAVSLSQRPGLPFQATAPQQDLRAVAAGDEAADKAASEAAGRESKGIFASYPSIYRDQHGTRNHRVVEEVGLCCWSFLRVHVGLRRGNDKSSRQIDHPCQSLLLLLLLLFLEVPVYVRYQHTNMAPNPC